MKKRVIVVITLLLVLSINVLAQPDDNAAVYYNKAFNLIRTSNPNYQKTIWDDEIKSILENGWTQNAAEVENLLNENKAALTEFNKAYNFEKCDFAFGKTYENPLERPVPNLLSARNIAVLAALAARRLERHGQMESAIDQYIRVLELGRHISQDKTFAILTQMVMGTIGNFALTPLEQYLKSNKREKALDTKLTQYFRYLKERSVSFPNSLLLEKENLLNLLSTAVEEEINQRIKTFPSRRDEGLKSLSTFKVIQKEVFDKYWDPFIAAARNNSAEEWGKANSQLNELSKRVNSPLGTTKEVIGTLLTNSDKLDENIATMICERLIIVTLPNFSKTFYENRKYQSKLDSIMALASEKTPAQSDK